ncbi:unnamed protein product [Owenia fusiformis]|uniref:TIR domain-containing protein n=1 Tax=Owenia fusiformis TaxID=6347 RepID=A0A8S4P676_OWEFU|nr:unnamed protein product [Owenia fusiformis]
MKWEKLHFCIFACLVVSISSRRNKDNYVDNQSILIENGRCKISCANSTDGCSFLCEGVNLTKGFPEIPGYVTDLKIKSCIMSTMINYSFGILPLLRSITVMNSKVKTVSNDAFSMMSNLTTVIITGNLLKSIPPNIFWLPLLKHVDLSSNLIRDINFPDNLTTGGNISINLSNNSIGGILNGTFREFTGFDAVSLSLAHNNISSIKDNTFSGINRFNTLDLSRNDFKTKVYLMDIGYSIQTIPTKELKLVRCNLNRHLDSSMFRLMSKTDIEILDLSENSWDIWPNDTLIHLPKLQHFTADHNPCFAFFYAAEELTNARYVSLASNALLKTQIVGIIFKNSPKLEYLDVSSNHFQFKINFHLLNISSLKTFNFSNNNQRIHKARRKMYFNSLMPNLEILRLHDINADWVNYIDLGDFVVTNMSKLTELDLSHNKICISCSSVIDKFKGLDRLHKLNMSYNSLIRATFDDMNAFFDQLPTLEIIDLSFNSLQHLPYNLFNVMPNLTTVILDGNRLTSFSDKYLRNNHNLEKLYLQRNALTWIDGNTFANIKLQSLDIRSNAFYCSCELIGLRKWLNSRSATIKVYGENQFCKTPGIYNDRTIKTFELPWLQCYNHLLIMLSVWIGAPLLLASVVAVIVSYFRWDIKYWWILRRSRRSRNGYTEVSGLGDNIFKYDGFVSYNSDNEDWVTQQLSPNLEHSDDDVNVKLCIAERDFTPGEFIADNIVNSINESRKLMFVITEEFIKSQWCAFELEMAHLRQFDEKKNLIVLIFLDKIPKKKLPRKIRLLMRHVTYVEWDEKSTRAQRLVWKKLKLSLLDFPCDLTYGVTP